ncbi:MAG TPA: GAF domain-containing protein [Dehalococcoidia bacterium]|nr:GAF domain-containing protein [Dehalococcoidia bacterium]
MPATCGLSYPSRSVKTELVAAQVHPQATWPYPLYELTLAVAAATEPQAVCEAALSCLQESLGVTRSSVLLLDEGGVMRFKAWRNLSERYRQSVEGHSPWSPSSTDAEPVLVSDVRLDPGLASLSEAIENEGIRSLAFIPLTLGTRLLGKFMLYYDAPHTFDDIEILTARTVAAHVAFALDQHAHREGERRARYIVDSLGVALYTTAADGTITYYNDEAAALWGRRPELGKERWSGAWRLFRPDGTAMRHEECPMAMALQQRTPMRGYEAVAERPDGTRVTTLPHPTPIFDAEGRTVGAVNVLVDITARKRAEEALEEREATLTAALVEGERLLQKQEEAIALYESTQLQLASLIEASSALIATEHLPDAVRRILEIEAQLLGADAYAIWLFIEERDQWEIILSSGLSNAYLSGATIPGGGRRQLAQEMVVEEVGQDPALASFVPRYKAERIASMFVSPLRLGGDSNGTVAFYYHAPHRFSALEVRVGTALANLASASLSAARLFDENERARSALSAANKELQNVAADLRIANAAKDEFLGLVSHELKTPLTTIRGNAAVLSRNGSTLDPGSRDAALSDIVHDAERLHRIIENLLALARAEQGQMPEAEPLLVVRVVERVAERHRQAHPEREIRIVQRGDPRLVTFSEACLEQVIENLISNAEKYSPATEPITIEFVRERSEVRLRILDRGVGINGADAARLFDPFFRADAARERAAGLGIGLAVCKRLVEAQGGRIWGRNRAGGGAEFGIMLPISEEDEPGSTDGGE